MKKIFIIMAIIVVMTNFISAEEIQNSGYNSFLKENIGKEITVNISTIDVSISGLLLAVFDDGIIIQTYFEKVYIAKTSIAFAKTKLEIKKN